MKKKKLLVFHTAIAPYRTDFFNALDGAFDATFYFCHENVPDQKFDQYAIREELSFVPRYLTAGFNFFDRSFRFGVIREIITIKPEIVISSEYSQITLLVFLYKILTKQEYKHYILSDDSLDISRSRKGYKALLRKLLSKKCNGVILPSQEVCQWFNDNISSKIKTVAFPIIHDEGQFRSHLNHCLHVAKQNLKKFNLNKKKVILFVGRLEEVKNLSLLLKAISKLTSDDFLAVIVGGGSLEKSLKDVSRKLNIENKVIFTGRKEGEELYSWYMLAHIFVLPSTFEPFGAVVNEALISGCSVICSEKAGASILINKRNGVLFNPHNEDDLVLKLRKFLENTKPLNETGVSLRASKMPFTFRDKIQDFIPRL